MAFQRGIDGPDPVRPDPVGRLGGTQEERGAPRWAYLATGALACPDCDAPVHPGARRLAPRDRISCPFCGSAGAVRDFLSLAVPSRPARVAVRGVEPS